MEVGSAMDMPPLCRLRAGSSSAGVPNLGSSARTGRARISSRRRRSGSSAGTTTGPGRRRYVGGVTSRVPLLAAVAAALTVTGELEVLLASAADSERLVSALALPLLTVPLAWSRRAPLAAPAVMTLALAIQAALGGFLAGSVVTTIAALVVALYCAGRYAPGALGLAGAAAAAAAVAATRVAFDPAAQSPREALLTFAAVAAPVLVGRWARGQGLLQRELADKTARRARDRARDARHAAEEERARIAADLQVAVAEGLGTIVGHAAPLRGELRAGDHHAARERLADIAGTARAALGDVRRVLGVLRHDGEAPRLEPPRTDRLTVPRCRGARAERRQTPLANAGPRSEALADRVLAGAVLAVVVDRACGRRRPRAPRSRPSRSPLRCCGAAAGRSPSRRRCSSRSGSRARCSTSTRSRSATSSRWSWRPTRSARTPSGTARSRASG